MSDFFTYYIDDSRMVKMYDFRSETYIMSSEIPNDKSGFFITKGYTATNDGLKQFAQDLYIQSEEIRNSESFKGFNYISSYQLENGHYFHRSHHRNVESAFKFKCKNKYEHHEPISAVESEWMESTFNAGLMYCEAGTYDCYGYDFSNYYASILASPDFRIPSGQGEERTVKSFPSDRSKIKTGFYRVKIECADTRVKKVFSFSNHNVYTSDMIKFAFSIQMQFSMTIELIQDDQPNAYIYLLNKITNGNKIFGKWYETMTALKKELPKNFLVKMLSSSLWGRLAQRKIMYKKESEAETMNIGLGSEAEYIVIDYITPENGESYYKLQNAKKPYVYNIRLKPWITSYGRIKTAKIILDHLDDVVRVHTDGVVFKTPKVLNIEGFIPEKKTTGKIQFNNLNDYHHIVE
jgi:hypothetical protein